MIDSNKSGVKALTELMNLQAREIKLLEQRVAPTSEVLKLKEAIKGFIEEVDHKLSKFVTSGNLDEKLQTTNMEFTGKFHACNLKI